MATFVNCAASTVLGRGDVVRVTFTENWSWQLDSGFKDKFDKVYPAIAREGALMPVSPNSAVRGVATATVDIRVLATRSCADVVSYLNSLNDMFVEVSRLERLTGVQKASPGSDEAAEERDKVTKQEQEKEAEDSPLAKFWEAMKTLIGAIRWIGVIILIVWLLPHMAKAKNDATASLRSLRGK